MFLKHLFSYICVYCVYSFKTIKSTQIECDPISNTDFGRRFCFIRHINDGIIQNVTFKPNPIADEKRELIFDNCTLHFLPLGIFTNFPNIKTLYGWNIKLKNLTKEVFRNSKELFVLDFSKNNIGVLDTNTFHLAKSLNQLDLSRNQIQIIHTDAFTGLEQLKMLNLDNNKLQLIPANCFKPLIQLQTIRLSHNLIKMIPTELFEQNIYLHGIYLNDNAIEWLYGELTFRHLTRVNEFDLHNNPNANLGCCVINAQSIDIRNTNSIGCYIGSRTRRVVANNNHISYIDSYDAISTNLEYVDLANNQLQKILNLTRFESLIHLDLMNNTMDDIGLNSFANMHRLEILNLQNSGLSKIYFGLFSHKSKLKILDISYNNLGNIDFQMFVSMTSLLKLHLDGNNLTKIDATELRKIFPALSKMSISQNNWSCQHLASIIKYLESNGIALDSIDSTKNTENIKGIPCKSNDESQIIENPVSLKESDAEVSKQKSVLTNIPGGIAYDQKLRLLQLKYVIQNTIESANEAGKKIENILHIN
ncbi:leucine-rich repeat-containing protein 15-like [Contarinia nasturtii]|uniref:leucine-rich repeat-containing protein 15-like n=1 Tax=Contarinia nasturtii TaxID=265458 RepID=UPI0012D3EFFF|nr:leucine-rich repeat-containing protein 15-like [Contarinia nasturtii]